ncbi:MAG: ATP-dependent DNA helicase RecG [Candidatus Doudnabacteria bacterium]|nr:ATP-dependent DNA helicase RecG [Candidatus Doudnabacteria bacterium]
MPATALTISKLLKLTKPQIAAFKKLGISTIQDLLLFFPYRYLDFSKTTTIRELKAGESVSLKVKINSIGARFSFKSRMSIAEAVVSDETGNLKVVWFNQGYLAKTLKTGDEIFLSGEASRFNNLLQLTNPLYEKVSAFPVHTARLVPVYHLTQSLYPRTVRNAIKEVLKFKNEIPETLPSAVLSSQNLLPISEAISLSHFPVTPQDVQNSQKRLDFEEIFINQLIAQRSRTEIQKKGFYRIPHDTDLINSFTNSLPFKLTDEQTKAYLEIFESLNSTSPMNRLLEGDVGSGKTLVALIAAIACVFEKYQVAFLAPTEILARQHMESAKKFLGSFMHKKQQINLCLLTSNFSETNQGTLEKKKLLSLASEGMPGIYIGTHALLEKNVNLKNLSLVIIDEQHRFGVQQRSTLINNQKKVPHLLSLTATPIPRTLKLAMVGELEISQIRQKPQGRKPITTKLVSERGRQKAYQFLAQEIKKGRQAFVITPLIEESETLSIKSAKLEAENLKKIFSNYQIGLLHGKLKSTEKEKVMSDFLQNKIQILVSTSVVEVGVDVPNASVMVIEGAERFGLSQLHQFRGRVGRSEHQSYCLLFPSPQITQDTSVIPENSSLKRLEVFCKTNDGFELAEMDLKLRGFGTLFGSEQSGKNYKFFNPDYVELIPKARAEAKKLLNEDPYLKNHPNLEEKIEKERVHFE